MLYQYTAGDIARFWARVDRTGNCWLWTGILDKDGYGRFCIYRNAVTIYCRAPRVAWELIRGPIPGRLHVLHQCPSSLKTCVRSDLDESHLYLGRQADNSRDMVMRGERRTKLTADMIEDIKSNYPDGRMTQSELASKHGISQALVWNVLNGRVSQRFL
jgi:hypothetical protein